MPPTAMSHINSELLKPALAHGDVALLDMGHGAENAVDPQLPAAAYKRPLRLHTINEGSERPCPVAIRLVP